MIGDQDRKLIIYAGWIHKGKDKAGIIKKPAKPNEVTSEQVLKWL